MFSVPDFSAFLSLYIHNRRFYFHLFSWIYTIPAKKKKEYSRFKISFWRRKLITYDMFYISFSYPTSFFSVSIDINIYTYFLPACLVSCNIFLCFCDIIKTKFFLLFSLQCHLISGGLFPENNIIEQISYCKYF